MQNKWSHALKRAREWVSFKRLASIRAVSDKTWRTLGRECQTTAQETGKSVAPRTVCVCRMTSFQVSADLSAIYWRMMWPACSHIVALTRSGTCTPSSPTCTMICWRTGSRCCVLCAVIAKYCDSTAVHNSDWTQLRGSHVPACLQVSSKPSAQFYCEFFVLEKCAVFGVSVTF